MHPPSLLGHGIHRHAKINQWVKYYCQRYPISRSFKPSVVRFCNKQRDKLKILFWDTNGFWLYYRRLEQGRFQWPNHAQAHVAMGIEQRQLQWLLSGLPVNNKTRHSTLSGLSVI
nr:IS66 family insertion sequence element accessory protein TnpB [Pseudoalteromonas sp. WY3]